MPNNARQERRFLPGLKGRGFRAEDLVTWSEARTFVCKRCGKEKP